MNIKFKIHEDSSNIMSKWLNSNTLKKLGNYSTILLCANDISCLDSYSDCSNLLDLFKIDEMYLDYITYVWENSDYE